MLGSAVPVVKNLEEAGCLTHPAPLSVKESYTSSGFVKLRRGILEHYQDGKVSAYEFHIYVLLILEANYENGVWRGCAEKLSIVYKIPARTCRDVLEKLHRKGYIKRFHVRGKHGNYPVLINKYECRDGAGNEVYLNAKKSTDWRHPIYESAATVPGRCRDGAAIQEVRTNNKEKTPRQNPARLNSDLLELEQRRNLEHRDYRLTRGEEFRREVRIGTGPETLRAINNIARSKTL